MLEVSLPGPAMIERTLFYPERFQDAARYDTPSLPADLRRTLAPFADARGSVHEALGHALIACSASAL